ncbi:MAG: type II toxin-antitoxin system Phd/YefM family antitoxin [Spirochaetes bacterium]|nr:type II toxin-antitoxin system Phd/YefM family antitoxin [Spirochaetota bacterium]
MMTVNIHEAKTHFSKLIKRACQGEDIIISKAGVPVVRLVPVIEKSSERVSGTAKGKIFISKNFDEPLPESIIKEFEN